MSFGPSAPKAPDYTGAAEAQSQGSIDLANQQTWANRPNMTTPWGSMTWTPSTTTDPTTGKQMTSWAGNLQLTPDQQQALDSQMAIQQGRSQAAQGLLGQATDAFSTPMDWSSLPAQSGNVQAGQRQNMDQAPGNIQTGMTNTAGDWRQQAQDAVWKMQEPMLQQRRDQLETQLTNQGITRGSEQWNSAMQQMGDEEERARLASVGAGRDEASMLFNQDLQSGQFANSAQQQQFAQEMARLGFNNNNVGQTLSDQIAAGNFNNSNRQQAISEGEMQRSQPLNELNALLTGQQVSSPNMPAFNTATRADAPQYLNAAGMQYQSALDRYNGGQAGQAGLMSGLFSLGGAAMNSGGWGGLFNFSDSRLKENIKILARLPNGIEICSYNFIGMKNRVLGVIAQQVRDIMPEAVAVGPDGFLRVNYNLVLK